MRRRTACSFLPLLLVGFSLAAAEHKGDYKAGIGRIIITPDKAIYLSGYAARTHASEGVLHDLWAKALAIEDSKGSRVVIVTTDLIGIPRSVADIVSARVQKQYGLDRARLLLNASHTHTGPMVGRNLDILFDLTPAERVVIDEYTTRLTDNLVAVVGAALGDLAPANLSFGNGEAGFAINRRQNTQQGVQIGANTAGPTDHDVPVLRVTGPNGKLRAILFGYACHNTTLTGGFYKISGDYAGFAQIDLEKAHPNTTAMFMALCGADQNPNPRSTQELAEKHGATLAGEVDRVLGGKLERVRGPIRPVFQTVELSFAPHTREKFETRANDKDVWIVRNAKAMLKTYDDGQPIRHYSYPVAAVQFGKDLTVLALGGEVVVDYALRVKKTYGSKHIIVAGYSNDVMSYIPSLRVLKEGGYEADTSMIYYGMPGPYDEDVEERIFSAIAQVMKRVGRTQ